MTGNMMYAPHILYKYIPCEYTTDEFGRKVKVGGDGEWIEICRCRCDDNNIKEFSSDIGKSYRPQYHIVCEGYANLEDGDTIRCMIGESIRGEGKVYNVKHLNVLKYTEIWV